MKICVNGKMRDVPTGSTLLDLLNEVGIEPTNLAVEHNGELLDPIQDPATLLLQEEDTLEIVRFVGGG